MSYLIKQIDDDFYVKEIAYHSINSGKYTYLLLWKKGLTTQEAINNLSNILKIDTKNFGYAGNKDKHAITEQYISIYNINKKMDINKINNKLNNIKIKLLGTFNEPISLGELESNHFRIIIRNINKKPNKIKYIPNYFDEQRFSKNNIEIGKAIIKRNFKMAVETLLKGNGYIEKVVRNYIKNNKNNFVDALRTVPKKIRRMYISAYQSYLWNLMASNFIIKNIKSNSIKFIDFSFGKLAFPIGDINNGLLKKSIDMIGFSSNEDKFEDILRSEGITLRDFIIKGMPELTMEGSKRKLFVDVKNLKIGEPENDELNKGKKKCVVEFELDKGSYATIAIKAMFL